MQREFFLKVILAMEILCVWFSVWHMPFFFGLGCFINSSYWWRLDPWFSISPIWILNPLELFLLFKLCVLGYLILFYPKDSFWYAMKRPFPSDQLVDVISSDESSSANPDIEVYHGSVDKTPMDITVDQPARLEPLKGIWISGLESIVLLVGFKCGFSLN